MNLDSVIEILRTNDGSLPDINIDFGDACVAGVAYALIQDKASTLVSTGAYYWSKSKNREFPITFGENPANELLRGDAEAFHVVFGGIRSSTGALVPDLGVFILGPNYVALDYRMGSGWNECAIIGLFEILRDLSHLSPRVAITHEHNIYDPAGEILMKTFHSWLTANKALHTDSEDAARPPLG